MGVWVVVGKCRCCLFVWCVKIVCCLLICVLIIFLIILWRSCCVRRLRVCVGLVIVFYVFVVCIVVSLVFFVWRIRSCCVVFVRLIFDIRGIVCSWWRILFMIFGLSVGIWSMCCGRRLRFFGLCGVFMRLLLSIIRWRLCGWKVGFGRSLISFVSFWEWRSRLFWMLWLRR